MLRREFIAALSSALVAAAIAPSVLAVSTPALDQFNPTRFYARAYPIIGSMDSMDGINDCSIFAEFAELMLADVRKYIPSGKAVNFVWSDRYADPRLHLKRPSILWMYPADQELLEGLHLIRTVVV